jgi:hypothetical protein
MPPIHDELRIALDPEPLPPREGYFFRLMARLGLREKNQHDERIQKAAEANRPVREAEARRALVQPGVSPETMDKALRVLGRIGKAEGFASLDALPVIAAACLALAVLP